MPRQAISKTTDQGVASEAKVAKGAGDSGFQDSGRSNSMGKEMYQVEARSFVEIVPWLTLKVHGLVEGHIIRIYEQL